ncbi:DUF1479-domain-containing protein [Punctularia strigosozonata HHB-11173 SS5]|uniref:DUF1479-domain-containing protein n=1 Tax=Punctularia strigosozonata (strain HHB-11173) TaxID=741275 RepID=R7S0V8_PUNST|nr:DUF1479-domain-containing protein [Punctularia strigosozonata HHB-11173 SS5]EIN04020.1 DUF1479-domain-containing protein [Punctularia strigosozonata HHB-11173 SS5]
MPSRFADLKREIRDSIPSFEVKVTDAWTRLLAQLKESTAEIAREDSSIIPQVKFSDLEKLSESEIQNIKRRGSLVIKDVVDDADAAAWKTVLGEFAKANPDVKGVPADDPQFFMLYWTKPQVEARAHPNVLAASAWLNKLYHLKDGAEVEGVDLETPLTYADRYRIRRPGIAWDVHPPHVDGGTIERWEDPNFRACFADILNGRFEKHDPYDLQGRLDSRSSLYGRPNQASIFRTFQGWLAMSETAPGEGTLKVFPDVLLSNAYLILRPFFRPKANVSQDDLLSPESWQFDVDDSGFPGIFPRDGGFAGPRPTPELHPHLQLDKTMISVPKVYPGDMVFWHCDVIHSVEQEHKGKGDSAVMYIPAVPSTPQNLGYVQRQKEAFLQGLPPPDFPKTGPEGQFIGSGKEDHIVGPAGRKAMGFMV